MIWLDIVYDMIWYDDCQSLIGWWFGVTHGDFAMAKCNKSPDLVGGLEYDWIIFHFIYGMSSFPLTNSIIFQGG